MSDAILIARAGVPVAAVITERFAHQGRLISAAKGMADLPQVGIPYPVAGTGPAAVDGFARQATGAILEALGLPARP